MSVFIILFVLLLPHLQNMHSNYILNHNQKNNRLRVDFLAWNCIKRSIHSLIVRVLRASKQTSFGNSTLWYKRRRQHKTGGPLFQFKSLTDDGMSEKHLEKSLPTCLSSSAQPKRTHVLRSTSSNDGDISQKSPVFLTMVSFFGIYAKVSQLIWQWWIVKIPQVAPVGTKWLRWNSLRFSALFSGIYLDWGGHSFSLRRFHRLVSGFKVVFLRSHTCFCNR